MSLHRYLDSALYASAMAGSFYWTRRTCRDCLWAEGEPRPEPNLFDITMPVIFMTMMTTMIHKLYRHYHPQEVRQEAPPRRRGPIEAGEEMRAPAAVMAQGFQILLERVAENAARPPPSTTPTTIQSASSLLTYIGASGLDQLTWKTIH